MNMERTYIKDVNKGKVLVKGWVHDYRDLGKIRFLVLRDLTGLIQITATADEPVFNSMKHNKEDVISVEGEVQRNEKAPNGLEIFPEKIELLGKAQYPLPIDTSDFSKTELPKRLDYRFLDLHNRKRQAIFKIQSEIAGLFREYFRKSGFIEMQPPSIISSASEGGTELFPTQYFEKKAFLAQSPQLYKQMVACSMEKTFTLTPVWRAEKHNTIRHLNEARQMDIEMAFADQFAVMKELENVVKYIVKGLIKNNKEDLAYLKLELEVPKSKYLSYDETIKLLQKNKIQIIDGEDLSPEAEKKLGELYPNTIVFVHSWPLNIKPFYIMPLDNSRSAGFDAIFNGLEISSGGQRIHIPELLTERIKAKGLDPENFKSYIDSFRYGSPEHAGWSIGLERFTMTLLHLDNIREACLFPRDRDRLTP